jgi:hypothetical protein
LKLALLFAAIVLLYPGVVILAGDMFGERIDYDVGDAPEGIIAADLNGDGDYDLAVANKGPITGQGDSSTVLINNGDGTFHSQVFRFGGPSFYSLTAADLDRDGDIDLAAASRLNGYVSIQINNGDGTFVPSYNYTAGQTPTWVCSVDLNGDGNIDLAVSNVFSADVSVLLNKGNGTFHGRVNYGVSESGYAVFAADFDSDGDNDLAVGTAAGVDILLNDGYGVFQTLSTIDPGVASGQICVGDFNNDDDYDIAVAPVVGDSIGVVFNNGDATFGSASAFYAGSTPTNLYAADFNRDGYNDLAVVKNWPGQIFIMINDGTGSFIAERNYDAGERTSVVYAADLDGDSDDDIAASNSQSDNITVYFNRTYVGKASLGSDTLDALDAYATDPIEASICVGALEGGYAVEDIDPFSVTINGVISPSSFYIINDHPEIPGEVVRMTFDLRGFIASYGSLWDIESQIYSVSGQYIDEVSFGAGGDVVIVGLQHGDANLDGRVDIGDPVFLIDFIYRDGSTPLLDEAADANGDGIVDMADVIYLINYIFREGPPPVGVD